MRSDDELLALTRQKATRIRRRRGAVASSAVLLTVALLGFTFTRGGSGPDNKLHTASDPAATSTTSTTTSKPAVRTTTTTSTTRPAAATTSTSRPAGPVTEQPPQSCAAATCAPCADGGCTAPGPQLHPHIAVDAATVAAGAPITFTYGFLADAGGYTSMNLRLDASPGDLGNHNHVHGSYGLTCGPARDVTEQITTSYRYPGTYVIVLDVNSSDPQCAPYPAQAATSITITVTAGNGASNGPKLPEAALRLVSAGGEQPVVVSFIGQDRDGFMASYTIDWGDGSAPFTYQRGTSSCREDTLGWPDDSNSGPDPQATHQYAPLTTHQVTMTAVSTGCDGGTPQQVQASISVST